MLLPIITGVIVTCRTVAGGTAITWTVPPDEYGRISHDSILLWKSPSSALLLGPGQTTWLDPGSNSIAEYCVQTFGGPQPGLGERSCGCGPAGWIPARWFVAGEPVTGVWYVIGPGCFDGVGFSSESDAREWRDLRSVRPADFNQSGSTDGMDFFDFITAFLSGDAGAEWDGNRGIGSADLYGFLIDFLGGA